MPRKAQNPALLDDQDLDAGPVDELDSQELYALTHAQGRSVPAIANDDMWSD